MGERRRGELCLRADFSCSYEMVLRNKGGTQLLPVGVVPGYVCSLLFCKGFSSHLSAKQELFPHLPALKNITNCFVMTLSPHLTVDFSTHCFSLAPILLFSIGRQKPNTSVFVRSVSLTLISQEPGSCQSRNAHQINFFFFFLKW